VGNLLTSYFLFFNSINQKSINFFLCPFLYNAANFNPCNVVVFTFVVMKIHFPYTTSEELLIAGTDIYFPLYEFS